MLADFRRTTIRKTWLAGNKGAKPEWVSIPIASAVLPGLHGPILPQETKGITATAA